MKLEPIYNKLQRAGLVPESVTLNTFKNLLRGQQGPPVSDRMRMVLRADLKCITSYAYSGNKSPDHALLAED